jgi:hypothetical protein
MAFGFVVTGFARLAGSPDLQQRHHPACHIDMA